MAFTWRFRCSVWGIVSTAVAAFLLRKVLSAEDPLGTKLISGVGVILLSMTSMVAFHIASLRCSDSHTLWSLLFCYVAHERERHTASSTLAKMTHSLRYPREAQEDMLRKITTRDASTEYGRANRLAEIRTVEDLRAKHPLTTYEHFKAYVEKLDQGKIGAFTGERPSRFGVTSGTTGVGKLIPFGTLYNEGNITAVKMNRLVIYRGSSRPSPVQKRCVLYTHPKHKLSKGGLIVAPYALITDMASLPVAEHTTPPPALAICDEPVAAYIHVLFAIADANLGQLASMFSPAMFRAFKLVENNWPAMLNDLSTGTINDKIPLSAELRRSIESYMVPDHGRVAKLRKEFEKGFEGIVKRIWPHLTSLEAIDILGYKQKIEETYGKGVIVASSKFGCTEGGLTGINMDIRQQVPSYVFLSTHVIVEFIPEEHIFEDQPRTLLINEVQPGQNYEIVMTTLTGLYRYRNGDVIQVVGLHENTPLFRLKYRTGELLNVATEKTNTSIVTSAIDMTVKAWGADFQLLAWTCTESAQYDPGTPDLYYVLFVELATSDTKKMDAKLSPEQKLKFDESLQACHDLYRNYRVSRTITAARVHVVSPGTFMALRDHTVSRTTASVNQYKSPLKLRTSELVGWMMKRVIDPE